MGPHPLWLLEGLLLDVKIEPCSRVLDLGSGRGATSVFLAKEMNVEVWALDLWVGTKEAETTFVDAGVHHAVHAVHAVQADGRALPFERDFFDAIVSIDAWEYFGTDGGFLPGLLRVLKPGGRVAMATPAMKQDVEDPGDIPPHINAVVGSEALAWHSPAWWSEQWEHTGMVKDVVARLQPTGWSDWLRWSRAVKENGNDAVDVVIEMLEVDEGDLLSFALVSATKK